MLINTLFVFIGSILLFIGAGIFVENSKNLALKFNIKPFIVAVTLVAFGTSSPELVVSLISALKDAKSMSAGNIIGSNIANIALGLGLASLIKPITISKQNLKIDFPIMIAVGILLFIFSIDLKISRIEGIVLIFIFVLYVIFCIFNSGNNDESNGKNAKKSKLNYILRTIIGCVIMVFGSNLLVDGGIFWARNFNINEIVIGLTVFAIGTSLPELATSTVAMFKNEIDISLGNIIGSNIQNIALVLAIVTSIIPLTIPATALKVDIPIMITYSVITYLFLIISKRLYRFYGITMILSYIIYVYSLFFLR